MRLQSVVPCGGNTGWTTPARCAVHINGSPAAQINTLLRPFACLIQHLTSSIVYWKRGTHNGCNIPFIGVIDEISLYYTRALTASEIQAIYNNGINGSVQGGNGKFDPNQLRQFHRANLWPRRNSALTAPWSQLLWPKFVWRPKPSPSPPRKPARRCRFRVSSRACCWTT